MKYFHDVAADKVVAENPTLQEVVQGRRLMLWRPGQTATVGAQVSMMFGGIAATNAILWLKTPSFEQFAYTLFGGLGSLALLTAVLFGGVVSGRAKARTYIYRFSAGMAVVSGCMLVASLLINSLLSIACSATALALNTIAVRLISGRSYALISAMFRAQRLRADSHAPVDRSLRHVR